MQDFEWKLHEMEKDYNSKLKYSKETVDEQIKEACRGILKEKDDEINKLGIKVNPTPSFCTRYTFFVAYISWKGVLIQSIAAEKGHG